MSMRSLSFRVAAIVLFAALGCTPRGEVSVAAEPAGTHCAHGGVRITDADGAVQYACNGAPGDDVQVDPEPAGAHCPEGGLRVTSGDGTVSYLCTGEMQHHTAATLCPGATYQNAPGGPGMFMALDGAVPIPGGAVAPAVTGHPAIEGAIEVAAICHGFDVVPPVGQNPGGTFHRPFTVVVPLSKALPLLMQAKHQGSVLDLHARVYGEDEDGAAALTAVFNLDLAQLALVEQFVAPDPAKPWTRRAFVRLAFVYQQYDYATFGPDGQQVVSSQPSFSALPPAADCAPVQLERDPMRADLTLNGADYNGIEVLGTCLRAERAYSGGLFTGGRTYGALVLVKPVDKVTPALQQALLQNHIAQVTVTVQQESADTGMLRDVFEEEVNNGRLVRYEQFLLDGTRMERVHFTYTRLRQLWLPSGPEFDVDLAAP